MCIEEELEQLRASVAELETRRASADAWRRIEARAFLALLGGHLQLKRLPLYMRWQVVDALDQLRVLRAYAQHRAGESEALRLEPTLSLTS